MGKLFGSDSLLKSKVSSDSVSIHGSGNIGLGANRSIPVEGTAAEKTSGMTLDGASKNGYC